MTTDPIDIILPIIKHPECWCEYVDIGVGMQKVAENPDCAKCTPFGLAAAVITALSEAGFLQLAEVERLRAVADAAIAVRKAWAIDLIAETGVAEDALIAAVDALEAADAEAVDR